MNTHGQPTGLHEDYTGLNVFLSPTKIYTISTPSQNQFAGKTDAKRPITHLQTPGAKGQMREAPMNTVKGSEVSVMPTPWQQLQHFEVSGASQV